MSWETVIGLEVHVQLATRSKLFSGAANAYGEEPNAHACAVDLAVPGTLPSINEEAVRMAVLFGLAVSAEIARVSVFARKNYFYPDLPKGYQISQFEQPILRGGRVVIEAEGGSEKNVGIHRAHLEEDAGKSIHDVGESAIDLNRAGVPLIEIVSEPDMRSPAEAGRYLRKIRALVRALGISGANMQQGEFRCDANVSVRPAGERQLGTRVEIKNLNSFRFIEKAIRYEAARQIERLQTGGEIHQETRLYDEGADETRTMRGKEEADDYRYFPDPDLPPLHLDEGMVRSLRDSLPELPDARGKRFGTQYGLAPRECTQLSADRELADYFERCVQAAGGVASTCAHWVLGELAAELNRGDVTIEQCPLSAERLGGLIRRIEDGTLSGKLAKRVFAALWQGEEDADTVIERQGLRQVSDIGAIAALIEQVLAECAPQVEQYRRGKTKVLGYLMGRLMQKSAGKINPAEAARLLRRKLNGGQAP